jgi:hypothetical protein
VFYLLITPHRDFFIYLIWKKNVQEGAIDDDTPRWSNLETEFLPSVVFCKDDCRGTRSVQRMTNCTITLVNLHALKFHSQNTIKSNIDWLDRPPASLVVEGQLRPAFAEEGTMVAKHLSSSDQ